MVREIVKDTNILTQQSERVEVEEAKEIISDLLDTAKAHIDNCAGLAAPQIGILKKVVVVRNGNTFFPMVNPTILKRTGNPFNSKEGCLSLEGERIVRRYPSILVSYQDHNGKKLTKTFNSGLSVIIQHEVDHLNGKLI